MEIKYGQPWVCPKCRGNNPSGTLKCMWCEVESKDMTDAQMVEKVVRKVMGWETKIVDGLLFISLGKDKDWRDYKPLTDANDTQMIKDKLREMGWTIQLVIEPDGATDLWLTTHDDDDFVRIKADTEARAICEAAIKAMEEK